MALPYLLNNLFRVCLQWHELGTTNLFTEMAYLLKNKCEFTSSDLKEKEKCDMMNPPDAACLNLKTKFNLLNSTCQSNYNTTIEDAKTQLKNDTKILSDILNVQQNSSGANSTTTTTFITTILNRVETLILNSFINAPRNQTIITPQLDVSIKLSRDICTPGVKFFRLILHDNIMEVPCAISHRDQDGAIFIVYKGFESKLNKNVLHNISGNDNDMAIVNSRVVTGATTNNLTSPVTFRLAHIQELKPSHNLTCVFWDPKKNDWSPDGCTTEYSESNDTHTTCSCNHFSSFAVLMAPLGLETMQENPILTIVSKVGLSLSVFCLVLSLLTFILCRSLRSAHMSVLTAMCSCLFLGQVLFLVGFQQTGYKILCMVIAGGLHFLFLCAFCWMSIESVLLFMTVRNLRAVNYMTSRKSNFPVMCLLGFGVPALVVGISASIEPNGYGTKNYCWLKPNSAIWSFLGPVAVFIITNTTLLVFMAILLRKRLATLNTNVSTLKNSRLLMFKAMAQLFILGCTWGIGFFQFGNSSLVISYIFTICNSLQGVYIFLVHCMFNTQVRQEYRKHFCRSPKHGKESSDESTPHDTTKSINLTEITKQATSEKSSTAERKVTWQ
ncbi:adhesion G protein-coupled receptor E1-like [Rhinoderma darwinii]|uniref:adhesion G protein-coupled receptor E1-like n=1 Tax=Rhinoderma darwinii TaxID=43563 RepID=UPI003F671F89